MSIITYRDRSFLSLVMHVLSAKPVFCTLQTCKVLFLLLTDLSEYFIMVEYEKEKGKTL